MKRWERKHVVIFCVMGFFVGSAFGFISIFDPRVIVGCLMCPLIIFSWQRKWLLVIFIIILLLGFMRSSWWQHEYGTAQLEQTENMMTQGYVSSEPDKREFNTRLTVTMNGSHERILMTIPHYPEYFYGDIIFVTGNLELPESFETDSGRVFYWDTFLRKDKIYYTMHYPEVRTLPGRSGSELTYSLLRFKQILLLQLQKYLPEPHASLMGGLLLGAKSSMGPDLLDDFRRTGVIHIVVLSGFNVTIIAESIMRVLAFLGVMGSAVFGSLSILFFTIMTGASATVVRASLMAFLVIVARVTGYQSQIIRALFVAGALMTLHNPMILLYDPSFQLSFLATLGLIVVVPWIETKLGWIPKTYFDFRGLAAASLGTQLFVLPMLIWMSGEVSLVSPVVNILVLWVVPVTMLLGFVVIIVAPISQFLVIPFMTLCWFLLSYILEMVERFSYIPFASVSVGSISLVTVIIIYMLYLGVWLYTRKYAKRNSNQKRRSV